MCKLLLETLPKVEFDMTTMPFYLPEEYPSKYTSWGEWFACESPLEFLDVPGVPSDDGENKGAIIALRKAYIDLFKVYWENPSCIEQIKDAWVKCIIGERYVQLSGLVLRLLHDYP